MEEPDKQVKRFVMALGKTETGNRKDAYTARGESGEIGRYQFMPDTYKAYAKKYLGDENADMSVENQNRIAYSFVKEKKDQNYTPAQIASMWNAGEGEPDAYTGTFKSGKASIGKNSKGVNYSVPDYVKKFSANYTGAPSSTTNVSNQEQAPNANQQSVPEVQENIPVPEDKPSIGKRILSGLNKGKEIATNVGVGVGSSIGKAGLDLGKAFLKLSAITAKKMGSDEDYQEYVDALESIKQKIYNEPFQQELETTAGKAGDIIGQGATFIAPSGAISSAANKASGLITGTGKAAGVARTVAGGVTEGLGNYGVGYGLSGGDTEDAKTAGLTSGILKIGISGIGELLKGLKIDKALMKNVFGTSKKEINAINSGKKTKTIAEEALERGIKGNTEQMTMQVSDGLANSEQKIMDEFAKAGNPKIKVTNPKRFIKAVKDKANLLRQGGADDAAQGLESSLSAIDPVTGEMSAGNALGLRRFLDGLRSEKSFEFVRTGSGKLSAEQAGLAEMADELRGKINSIGLTGEAMKDYQFYIEALNRLEKFAVSSKNEQALGLIQKVLLGDAIFHANPYGAALVAGEKFLKGAKGSTNTAQGIKNLPKSSSTGSGIRTIIGNTAAGLVN
jgi:hypothetical protein